MKNTWNTLSNLLIWLVLIVAVCMMIFTFVSVNIFNQGDREIFGYRALIVMSDSMSKTDFDAGDIVLIKKVDPSTLKEGDIISYVSQDKASLGETITHKIRRLVDNEVGEPGFVTYGTTTGMDDTVIVTYPYILGKYQGNIPKIGSFFYFLKTTKGYITCILLPFLLLISFQAVNCIQLFRKYREEQMEEMRIERERLKRERIETEEMVRQLQKLREQIGETDGLEISKGTEQKLQ